MRLRGVSAVGRPAHANPSHEQPPGSQRLARVGNRGAPGFMVPCSRLCGLGHHLGQLAVLRIAVPARLHLRGYLRAAQ